MLFLYNIVKPEKQYRIPDEQSADLISVMSGIKELDIKYQHMVIDDILKEMIHLNKEGSPFYYDLLITLKDIEDSIKNNQKIPTLSHINPDYVMMYLDSRIKYRRLYYSGIKKNRQTAIETKNDKLLAESNELITAYNDLPSFIPNDKIKINIPASFAADWLVESAAATVIGETMYGTLLNIPKLEGVKEYDPNVEKMITHTQYYIIDYSYPAVWVELQGE